MGIFDEWEESHRTTDPSFPMGTNVKVDSVEAEMFCNEVEEEKLVGRVQNAASCRRWIFGQVG